MGELGNEIVEELSRYLSNFWIPLLLYFPEMPPDAIHFILYEKAPPSAKVNLALYELQKCTEKIEISRIIEFLQNQL